MCSTDELLMLMGSNYDDKTWWFYAGKRVYNIHLIDGRISLTPAYTAKSKDITRTSNGYVPKSGKELFETLARSLQPAYLNNMSIVQHVIHNMRYPVVKGDNVFVRLMACDP